MTHGERIPVSSALSRNLRDRIASAIVLVAIALLAAWWGGLPFRLFCAAVGGAVIFEWMSASRAQVADPLRIIAPGLVAAVLVLLVVGSTAVIPATLAAIGVATVLGIAAKREAWSGAGVAYALAAAIPLSFIRDDAGHGLAAIWFLFAVVWSTDILAYFTGRALGGAKLAPSISPGKTWSGAIGGLAAALVFGALMAWVLGMRLDVVLLALMAGMSIASQSGDLFESWVKRRCGVKDSSHLIPGHGGVMDRVDGLLAAALLFWLVGSLLSGPRTSAAWLFP